MDHRIATSRAPKVLDMCLITFLLTLVGLTIQPQRVSGQTIGDVQDFRLMAPGPVIFTNHDNHFVYTGSFTLRDITDTYYLWVQSSNASITDADVSQLRERMFNSAVGSVDESKGMLEIMADLAGVASPIDFVLSGAYDADPKLDILVHDFMGPENLEEDRPSSTHSCDTLPFGTPICVGATTRVPFVTNQRDIMYVDAIPNSLGLGLNPLLQGLTNRYRGMFLGDQVLGRISRDFVEERHEIALGLPVAEPLALDMSSLSNFPLYGPALSRGVSMGEAFKYYVASNIPLEAALSPVPGSTANFLTSAGTSYREQIMGFYSAVLVNDATISPRFALPPYLRNVVSPIPLTGQKIIGTPEVQRAEPGSATYLRYDNVQDLAVTIDASHPFDLAFARQKFAARAFLYGYDGSVSWTDITLNSTPTVLSGAYDHVILLVAHLDPDYTAQTIWIFGADWSTSTASEEDVDSTVPRSVTLAQNYPNPFNPVTTISFEMPAASHARLSILDLLGREVALLTDQYVPAGHHEARFDAGSLPSGSYLYKLEAGGTVMTRILTLTK
jgi:hypothetical protein